MSAAMQALLLLASLLSQDRALVKVHREVYVMGTVASLKIHVPDRTAGLDQLEGFTRLLEDTERELSTWREESSLSRLNRNPVGAPLLLDPDLCRLLRELKIWYERTGRTFDPTVGSLIRAWGLREQPRRPSPAELRLAMIQSGLDHFQIDAECKAFREREIIFDAGGFGKGEALDRVRTYALEHGADRWMVNLGGQVMVSDRTVEGEPFRVELAHPAHRDHPVLEVSLHEGSIATSSGSERDGHVGAERVGHILDPRTGYPVSPAASVAVWHRRGLVADLLSTSLYVMGVEEGLRWAEEHGIAACFLIPDGERVKIRVSESFRKRFLSGPRQVDPQRSFP